MYWWVQLITCLVGYICFCTTFYSVFSVSASCEGRTVFLAETQRPTGYTYSAAGAACVAHQSMLVESNSIAGIEYYLCVEMLLRTIPDITKTPIRAWTSDCAADLSTCGQYAVDYFIRGQSTFLSAVSITSQKFTILALCSKGKTIYPYTA